MRHVPRILIGGSLLFSGLAGEVSPSRSRIKENGKDPSTLSGTLVPQMHAYPSLLGTSRWCLPLGWSHVSDVENVAVSRLPRALIILCVPPRKLPEGAPSVERKGVGLREFVSCRCVVQGGFSVL